MKRTFALAVLLLGVTIGFKASFNGITLSHWGGTPLPRSIGAGYTPSGWTSFAKPTGKSLLPRPIDITLSPNDAAAGERYRRTELRWVKTRGTGAADSLCVYAKGSFGSDTTQAVAIENIPFPVRNEVTSADSASWFDICVGSCGVTAPTADSIYVGAQVSMDGVSWVAVTPNQVFFAASTIPPAAAAIIVESTSSNQFGYHWKISGTDGDFTGVVSGATAPNARQLFGWNYIRFIVTWSIVDATSATPFSIAISRWED